ncbi:hypothetical protein LTR99_009733 [Exophiala xenobiotica]|uniref:Uncharacterized protein n=1 Tax=Vermiconidia calcicola TaxID=1690605 RepID=A0AAV9PVU7_9PEZI|nr:hypothetical protein LTR72_007122 [Exophiala xenobiotica]KAK5530571.1 hypothetical protein LTR25_009149 [Vermiconidia calcicola]KAK5233457.1 hypothetical protein LTR47_005550 [Exophiala xenobiotica]KAK5261455.1 hypothetical protein LTR40_002204 [Exophiala xenobiotica]KAK5290773.1 hypothetical protein LTR14_006280 [Exophiala xenobiotica]
MVHVRYGRTGLVTVLSSDPQTVMPVSKWRRKKYGIIPNRNPDRFRDEVRSRLQAVFGGSALVNQAREQRLLDAYESNGQISWQTLRNMGSEAVPDGHAS